MRSKLLAILMVLVVVAAACSPATPEVIKEQVIVEKEVPVTVMVEKEVVVEKMVTATPLPPDFPRHGGTLRTDTGWIPYMEDPAADGVGTGQVGISIAEALVWVDGYGVVHPQLLKSWEANENATEWTFHLQEGVKFNNGKPFGADDVIWNILHWLDPDTGASAAANLSMLSPDGVKKVDDLTVKFTLDLPNADFLYAFYDYPTMIAPEGGWKDFYSGNPADAIGTGPFMLESFIPDERFVLVRNPNYWQMGADGKALPYLDKVIVTTGWDDAARLAALIGNGADIMSPGEGVLAELEKYPDEINIQTYHTGWITPIVMRVDMPPFDDVRVRQALKLVQDRQQIKDLIQPMSNVYYDHWIPSGDPAYCPDTDVDGRPQNIEKAKALLAEAGYPDGLTLELAVPEGDFRTAYAQVYKEQAALAGITININLLPSSAFWDQWMEWPFSVSGWNGRVPATTSITLALTCGADWNESRYCNKELDTLLDQARATADVEARRALYCQIQTIMQEDGPYLIPFAAVEFSASRSNVHFLDPENWSRGSYRWYDTWLSPD